jgi:hypothetical protein
MNTKAVSIGWVLAGVALHAPAVTIGPATGAVWVGRPLELRVPVGRDTELDGTTLCARADVYYAETQQEPARIQIDQEPTEQPHTVQLRLRSTALVDEPVVTIHLRVGCEDSYVRRFVLLADLPVVADPAPQREASGLSTAPASPVAAARIPATSLQQPSAAARVPKPKIARQPSASVAAAPKAPPRAATWPDKLPHSRGARLQLDPLEVLVARVKTLESAAAAPTPQPAAKETELLLRMEDELQSMRQQTIQNEATLLAMRKRLEQAESERVSVEWLYGLLGLVVVCVATIVALWQRQSIPLKEPDEPASEEPEPYEAQFLGKAASPNTLDAPFVQQHASLDAPPSENGPVDVNVEEFEDSTPPVRISRLPHNLHSYNFNST